MDRILELRRQLRDETEAADPAAREPRLAELRELQSKLAQAQGESPLILPSVDAQAVASVVADWTGVPVGRMVKNEVAAVLKLADTLGGRVVGQRHGLEMIARRIQTSRARLDNPSKPIGVFLLVGPSGVGKTETALALAESLYGGEDHVITINMSEFQEAHTVSTLKGAPPGYVGYERGGVLTEAVRRRPYSIVLLDEVEKAHPDVHEIFFQVFDKGWMEDSDGRYIDFKNTVILLTSNVGTDRITDALQGPGAAPRPRGAGPRGARAPAQGVSAGAARAPGGRALLPLARRDPRRHHPPAARPHRPAHRRASQGAVHVRRRRGQAGGLPLHRGGERRPHDRRDPDQHLPAADQRGVPDPHGGGAPARRHRPAGQGRRLLVRVRLRPAMARIFELTTPLGQDVLLFRSHARARGAGPTVGVRPLGGVDPSRHQPRAISWARASR